MTEVKTEKKFVIISDECEVSDVYTEDQLLAMVNEMRICYIQDEVDPDYIKENFPTDIKSVEMAKLWLSDMGEEVVEVPEKLNETQRIFTKLFKDNGKLCGKIKRKEQDYFDQGTWNFQISLLDLDEDNKARLQLKAQKICPSGAWDNGIEVVYHPQVSLYELNKDLDWTIKYLINRHFRSDRGVSGREYKVVKYSI